MWFSLKRTTQQGHHSDMKKITLLNLISLCDGSTTLFVLKKNHIAANDRGIVYVQ